MLRQLYSHSSKPALRSCSTAAQCVRGDHTTGPSSRCCTSVRFAARKSLPHLAPTRLQGGLTAAGGSGGAANTGDGGGRGGPPRKRPFAFSGGSGGGPRPSRLLAQRLLLAVLAAIGVILLALPAILSSPLALESFLRAANRALPGKLEAKKLNVKGWLFGTGAVHIHGIRLSEATAEGGQQLLWLPSITVEGTLWRALSGQGTPSSPVHITIKEPDINGAYSMDAGDFRFNRFLMQAGLLAPSSSPSPAPAAAAPDPGAPRAAEAGSAEAGPESKAVSPGGKAAQQKRVQQQQPQPQPLQLEPQQQQGQQLGQQQQQQQQQQKPQKHSKKKQEKEKEEKEKTTGEEGAQGGHGAGPSRQERGQGSPALAKLANADSFVRLWVQVLRPEQTVRVIDGKLRVNQEISDLLGGQLVVKGTFGDRMLRQEQQQQQQLLVQPQREQQRKHQQHTLLPLWRVHVHQQPRFHAPPPHLPQGASATAQASNTQGGSSSSSSSSSSNGGGSGSASVTGRTTTAQNTMAGACWWVGRPSDPGTAARLEEACGLAGGPSQCVPAEWQVLAPNLNVHMRGWEVDATRRLAVANSVRDRKQEQRQQQGMQGQQQGQHLGSGGAARASAEASVFEDLPPKFTLLQEPASMSLRFSQALSRSGFPLLAPTLGQISSLAEGSGEAISATFTPDGMTLPFKSASVHMSPLRVRLAASPALVRLITVLRGLPQGLLAPGSEAAAVASGDVSESTLKSVKWSSATEAVGLDAWMSGMHVRLEQGGAIEQRRLDVLLGPMGSLPGPHASVSTDTPGKHQGRPEAPSNSITPGSSSGPAERTTMAASSSQGNRGGASSTEDMGSSGTQEGTEGVPQSREGKKRGSSRVVHLALWGGIDPTTDRVSMTLGVAGSTLQNLLGLHQLPDGYFLPLNVRGTTSAPTLEYADLTTRLARLAVLRLRKQVSRDEGSRDADASQAEHEQPKQVVSSSAHGRLQQQQQQQQQQAGEEVPGLDRGVDAEPEGQEKERRGFGRRLLSMAGWALRVAVVNGPGQAGLERVERQVAAEAAQVPTQECDVPWLKEDS